MKRTILLALLFAPFLGFSQGTNVPSDQDVEYARTPVNDQLDPQTPVGQASNTANKKDITFNTIVIGETYYDLQTNSSIGRRVLLHADGTVSAVWTTSPNDNNGFPSRGSGYNHDDGGGFASPVRNRLESSTRTGWPSIGILSTDQGDVEYVVAHESNTGGFALSINDGIGSNNWSSEADVLDDETAGSTNRVPIWNRSASSGEYIHLISNYWFSEDNNVPRVTRAGVQSPTTYSRSTDGGETWDIQHMLLPGYDSTLYIAGGGDNYAIDVRDSIVAIVIGGLADPISLWKSTDNGDSFTYYDVDAYPFKGTSVDGSTDTTASNDGSLDVIINADGEVHVFWGYTRVYDNDDPADESFQFEPAQSYIGHWKEGDVAPKRIYGNVDLNNNGTYDILTESWAPYIETQGLPATLLSATRTGNTSTVTMPSASIDENGNIYVVYTVVVEGLTSRHFLNANFRDVMVIYSTNGGDTWSVPQNLTQSPQTEDIFACVAKSADDFLHVIWQSDETPGTNLQNHDPVSNTHPSTLNNINYAAVPVADILDNSIGQITASVDNTKTAKVFVVSQNYPNPFENNTEVTIYLRAGSDIQLTVTDMTGKVVNSGDLGFMNAGNHNVTIDASTLSPGMYFYTITSGNNSVTRKMQVK
ncbi:T9SS type A sorting domain-containing protein [bacterium]|nr:T9SS type A sorting domain-containing protein [bacterium]